MSTPAPAQAPAENPEARPPVPPAPTGELELQLRALLAFFLIGFVVWLAVAWRQYRTQYAQSVETWRKGSKQLIEITLVREDKQGLACASDRTIEGLACEFRGDNKTESPAARDDARLLRPYNTVKNELFLAAGLWSQPALSGPLPPQRFSVVCNYEILGIAKTVSLRWGPTASFDAAKQSIPAGVLSDCAIPR